MSFAVLDTSHRFLEAQPWFAPLSAAARDRVGQGIHLQKGKKGETLLHANTPVKGWYAVLSGLVKLESLSEDGRRSTFLGAPAGEWFGEGSALKTEPRRYDVIALRDTELLCLPRPLFDELRSSSLAFNQFLVQHLNMRLGQAMAIIEASRTRSPEQRVAVYLSRIVWPGLRRLDLSQEELGHLVGLSRQTVNKALQSLEKCGLVSLASGRMALLDEQALQTYLAAPSKQARR